MVNKQLSRVNIESSHRAHLSYNKHNNQKASILKFWVQLYEY